MCLSSPAVSSGSKPPLRGWGVCDWVVVSLSKRCHVILSRSLTALGLTFLPGSSPPQFWGIGQTLAAEPGRSGPAHRQPELPPLPPFTLTQLRPRLPSLSATHAAPPPGPTCQPSQLPEVEQPAFRTPQTPRRTPWGG